MMKMFYFAAALVLAGCASDQSRFSGAYGGMSGGLGQEQSSGSLRP